MDQNIWVVCHTEKCSDMTFPFVIIFSAFFALNTVGSNNCETVAAKSEKGK